MQKIQLNTVLALTLVIGACSKSGKNGSSGGTSESANPYQAVVQSNGAVLRVTGISDATAQKMMVLVNVLAPTGSNGNPSIERLPIDKLSKFASDSGVVALAPLVKLTSESAQYDGLRIELPMEEQSVQPGDNLAVFVARGKEAFLVPISKNKRFGSQKAGFRSAGIRLIDSKGGSPVALSIVRLNNTGKSNKSLGLAGVAADPYGASPIIPTATGAPEVNLPSASACPSSSNSPSPSDSPVEWEIVFPIDPENPSRGRDVYNRDPCARELDYDNWARHGISPEVIAGWRRDDIAIDLQGGSGGRDTLTGYARNSNLNMFGD